MFFTKLDNKLDDFALLIIGKQSINKAPSKPEIVLQYWSTRSNISIIFATIFSSISLALLIELSNENKLILLPFVFLFIYFSIKTWAYNRCANMACRIWL